MKREMLFILLLVQVKQGDFQVVKKLWYKKYMEKQQGCQPIVRFQQVITKIIGMLSKNPKGHLKIKPEGYPHQVVVQGMEERPVVLVMKH